jgi:DNA-directed RNA polymerase specialized sigma24 family protein
MLLDLNGGDRAAVRPLWERYFTRLVGLARARLIAARRPRGDLDEEDVALSAFASFCDLAARGRFPRLGSRDDLWRLLVVITARKAAAHWRKWKRRGGGRNVDEQALLAADSAEEFDGLAQVIGDEPTPDFAAEVAEEFRRLIDALGRVDDDLRRIAVWKMEGDTTAEIAAKLGCVRETVSRRTGLIKKIWIEAGLVSQPGALGTCPGEGDPDVPAAPPGDVEG